MLKRADYNVDTLEDRVTLDYQSVITGIDQIKDSVKGLKSQLDKIGKNTGIPKLNNQIKQSSGFSKTLKGIAGIGTAVVTGRKMIKTLQGMTDESVNFVETANLFSVSMGKGLQGLNQYYERAVKFQNELEEKLGVNIEESMNYQALFNSMSKSMGISAKYAYILSENFTKLGYDLSSLYNIDPENAMQKLRAGLAGQTKPLRDLGLDITQQSLQPIADSLGIERSVKNMSQAEKMVLRYIAVLKQAQIAQGDFANTMESPANQLRIFNAQVVAFKRNMGNLWQGLLGGVLPYVNAIMMVINELLKMIAKLFGFKVSDQKVNLSANIGADDLASDLGTASGKAKELKNQLMGFDEINNITLPSSSGGGSGGISGGGIDQRLLDAMKEYDNLMGKVKNKATDIRDKIMKWLGFTKKINPLTGEISWEYTGMSKQAKTILGILKTICALYIGAKILKLIGWLNTLRKVLLGSQKATTSFQAGLALLGKETRTAWTALKLGVEQFKLYRQAGDSVTKSLGKTTNAMLSLIPNTVKVAGGIAGLVGSCVLAYKSMEDLKSGSIGATEGLLKLAGGIAGATASGALIGSVFGPAGTVIGALTGLVISGTTALQSYNNVSKELRDRIKENGKAIEESTKTIEERTKATQDTINNQMAELEYTEKLTKELENLTDSNGKVKTGYEERAKFILNQLNEAFGTEYELTDGRIYQNGKLIDSIDGITSSIYKTIEAKKAEIILNANEENYAKAIQESTKLYQQKETAIKNCSDAQSNFSKILEDYGLTMADYTNNTYNYQKALVSYKNIWTQSLVNARKSYEEATQKVDESTKNWTNCCKTITDFENLKTATISANQEEVDKILQQMTKSYETESGVQTQTINQQMKKEIEIAKYKKEQLIETQGEINEETEKLLNAQVEIVANSLKEQTQKVEDLTPEIVEAWKALGENNYKIYQEKLNLLDPATKQKLQEMTGIIVEKTPEVEKVTKELSDTIIKQLDNSPEARQKAMEAVKGYMQGLSEDEQRNLLKQCGIDNADKVIEGLKQGDLSEDVGINIIKGLRNGLQNNYWQGRTLSTAFSFATNVLNRFKNTFGIHSPSRKTNKFGVQLLEGLGLGVKKESRNVLNTVSGFSNKLLNEFDNPIKEFSDGIEVDTKELSVNASEFVDYGSISGNISTKINNNNLGEIIVGAIINGMQKAKVQVDIEAKADEGIIVRKASKGFTEYVEQTGELPFPVPV